MAGKWHIDINGNVAPCGAEKIECPRQRAGSPHFTSEEEGCQFYEVNGTGETIDVPYFVRADPAEYVS